MPVMGEKLLITFIYEQLQTSGQLHGYGWMYTKCEVLRAHVLPLRARVKLLSEHVKVLCTHIWIFLLIYINVHLYYH